jgi:multidrug efflux pump subunit AcrA (membrane-fusion protein)
MLAEVRVEGADRTPVTVVPKNSVQNIGDRSFVYLPKHDAPTQFTEREVRLGAQSGEHVHVLSGLKPGDQVVAEGSFFLRAERERVSARSGRP